MLPLRLDAHGNARWGWHRRRLTPTEERIVRALLQAPHHHLTWDQLYRAVYGMRIVEQAQLYWHLHHLRRKLGAARFVTLPLRGVVLR